jgi:hypothetical protein
LNRFIYFSFFPVGHTLNKACKGSKSLKPNA